METLVVDGTTKVSPEEYERLVDAIENPPPPNEALKNAMSKYFESTNSEEKK